MIGSVAGLPSARAQEETPERVIAKAKLYYESGRYQDAFNELVALLGQKKEFKPGIMVDVYKYLGFCYSAYDRRDLAKKQFKNALRYDPSLELDPVFTSPKIMQVFTEAKQEFTTEMAKKRGAKPPAGEEAGEEDAAAKPAKAAVAPRVTVRRVAPTSTLWRSLLLPGWGQFHTGHYVRGGISIGAVVLSLGMALNYHNQAITAEENFWLAHNSSTEEKEKLWDEVESAGTMRTVFTVITALAWAGNGVDAFFCAKSPKRRAFVTPYYALDRTEPPAVGLTYHAQF